VIDDGEGFDAILHAVKQPDLALIMHLRGRQSDNGASPICLVYSGRCCCLWMVFKGSPDPCLYYYRLVCVT
jgi:hypothetical protein